MILYKICSKCGIEKSTTEFNKNKRNKDGLGFYCRKCSDEYNLLWRRNHGILNRQEGYVKRSQNPEWCKSILERNKEMGKDPKIRNKLSIIMKQLHKDGIFDKVYENPEWIRKQKEGAQRKSKDLEWIKKITKINQDHAQDSEWIRNHQEGITKLTQSKDWIEKNIKQNRKQSKDPEWIRKQKEGAQRTAQDPEWLRKNKEILTKRNKEMFKNPQYVENYRRGRNKMSDNIKWREGITEYRVGGFWYGSIKNDLPLSQLIHQMPEYRIWIKQVLERDEYKDRLTQQVCIRPEAHHIIEVHKIIKKYNLRTLDDARNCSFLWDINNGECLEHENHIKIHGFNYDEDEE